jgi:NTE family protein
LALGSGSARGWSHIGILHVLEGAGISPDIVCGTSVALLIQKGSRPSVFTGMCTRRSHRLRSVTQRASG